MLDSYVDQDTRGSIACLEDDANTCSCCTSSPTCEGANKCPEVRSITEITFLHNKILTFLHQWTSADVTRVLQSTMTITIVLAAILLCYAIGTLRYGVELKQHISMYEIDYV